jgi:hypothetical protein
MAVGMKMAAIPMEKFNHSGDKNITAPYQGPLLNLWLK